MTRMTGMNRPIGNILLKFTLGSKDWENKTKEMKASTESFQALWIEISFVKKKNVICGVLYRQHNSPESFLKYLEETIDKFTSTGKNLCLLGDFNLCLQKIETCNYNCDLLLALQSCYLLPTIYKPTRVHNNSASLIDNIFVNNPEQVLISGNLITDVSDHFSQFCILTSTRDKIKRKQIKKRDLSHFNPDSLNSDLATIDWSCIIKTQANNVDELFSTFYRNFNKIINKHAPIKTLSQRRIKQFSKPWITKGIRTSIKEKNRLYQIGDQEKYKYYRNKICSLTRLSKKHYYCAFFNNNLNNMKKT